MRKGLLLWLGLLLVGLSVVPGVAGRTRNHTLDHQGKRTFRVFLPSEFDRSESLPLVLVFGGAGSAGQTAAMTGFDELADRERFVVVYPEGTSARRDGPRTWNAGGCCGAAASRRIDDVGFVAALLDFVGQRYGIDSTRVYATGHSGGAMFVYRLACELSVRIAAIAPNAGLPTSASCEPARRVPVLHLHGNEDACSPFGGGPRGACFLTDFPELDASLPPTRQAGRSVPVALSDIALSNRCAPYSQTSIRRGALTCESYQGCERGAEVTLCTVRGGGHTWPGGQYPSKVCGDDAAGGDCRKWRNAVGPIQQDVDANGLIWEFFQRHRLFPVVPPRESATVPSRNARR